MKHKIRLVTLLVICISALACAAQSKNKTFGEDLKSCWILTHSAAEKILGQTVRLTENETEVKDNSHKLKCTYTAVSKDKASGRDINLYFMLEESLNEDQAKQIYKTIWESNKNHMGIEKLSGVGDEAYAHSDRSKFHWVMVRKGKFTVRFKVNKAVETTSFDELKAFAKRAAEQIHRSEPFGNDKFEKEKWL